MFSNYTALIHYTRGRAHLQLQSPSEAANNFIKALRFNSSLKSAAFQVLGHGLLSPKEEAELLESLPRHSTKDNFFYSMYSIIISTPLIMPPSPPPSDFQLKVALPKPAADGRKELLVFSSSSNHYSSSSPSCICSHVLVYLSETYSLPVETISSSVEILTAIGRRLLIAGDSLSSRYILERALAIACGVSVAIMELPSSNRNFASRHSNPLPWPQPYSCSQEPINSVQHNFAGDGLESIAAATSSSQRVVPIDLIAYLCCALLRLEDKNGLFELQLRLHGSSPHALETILAIACHALASNKFDVARSLLSKLLPLTPHCAREPVILLLARVFDASAQPERSLSLCRTATRMHPHSGEAWSALAHALCRVSLSRVPYLTLIHSTVATRTLLAHALQRCRLLLPDDPSILHASAILEVVEGRLDAAVSLIETALASPCLVCERGSWWAVGSLKTPAEFFLKDEPFPPSKKWLSEGGPILVGDATETGGVERIIGDETISVSPCVLVEQYSLLSDRSSIRNQHAILAGGGGVGNTLGFENKKVDGVAELFVLLGLVQYRRGEKQKSRAALESALILQGRSKIGSSVLVVLGSILCEDGQMKEGIDMLETAIRAGGDGGGAVVQLEKWTSKFDANLRNMLVNEAEQRRDWDGLNPEDKSSSVAVLIDVLLLKGQVQE